MEKEHVYDSKEQPDVVTKTYGSASRLIGNLSLLEVRQEAKR